VWPWLAGAAVLLSLVLAVMLATSVIATPFAAAAPAPAPAQPTAGATDAAAPNRPTGAVVDPALAGAVENVDYSFLDSAKGVPSAWDCGTPIVVLLAAGAPEGARGLLEQAVDTLIASSGIPLVVAKIDASADLTVAGSGSMLVRYLPTAEFRQQAGGVGDGVGVASTIYGGGRITSSTIAIDRDQAAPTGDIGIEVLTHELAHGLGLGHSTDPAELMAPVADPANDGRLQPGDRAGLQHLGCPRP
jgi:Matrixin